jgi:hypothetical protein
MGHHTAILVAFFVFVLVSVDALRARTSVALIIDGDPSVNSFLAMGVQGLAQLQAEYSSVNVITIPVSFFDVLLGYSSEGLPSSCFLFEMS